MLKKFTLVNFILLLLLLMNSLVTSAQVALVIANPAAVCSPGTVNITSSFITQGSTLPAGTTLSYYVDLGTTVPLTSPSIVTAGGTYYIKATNGGSSDVKPVVVTINQTPLLVITNPPSVCAPVTIDLTASAITAGSLLPVSTILSYYTNAAATTFLSSPSAVAPTGTFYIKATTPYSCTDIKPVSTVVNPMPVFTITSNNPTTCTGADGSITLNGLTAGKVYLVNYNKGGVAQTPQTLTATGIGTITLTGLNASSYTGITVTSASGCVSPAQLVTLTDPTAPSVIAGTGGAVCTGSSLLLTATTTLGATYVWTGPNGFTSLAQNPIIPSTVAADSGVYFVTITVAACTNNSAIIGVVHVSPALTITNPAAVCSPSTIDITASAVTAGSIGGTSFTYFTDAGATTPVATPFAVATSGIYYIKYSSPAGCNSVLPVVTIINQTPVITSAVTNTICNNTAQAYTITSNIAGTTFSWSRPVVAGISNPPGSGTSSTITETLTNTTSLPVNVVYNITPNTTTCTGAIFTYTVTVNPTATIISAPTDAICSNIAQSYAILSATPLATYTWSRPVITGISNSAAFSSSTSITETLVNTTNSAIDVAYTIIPQTAAGCPGTPFVHTVTVNPNPILAIVEPSPVCSGSTVDITSPAITSHSNLPNGTTLSYYTDNAATIVLLTPSSVSITGNYYIKASTIAGCNNVAAVVVAIIPTTTPTFNPLPPICKGSFSPVLPNTSTNAITGIWSPATVGNTITGTYTFTPAAGQCATTTTLTQVVRQASTSTTNLSICSSALPYTWNGVSHNAAGIYTTTLVNSIGCDSIARLNLAVNPTSSSITAISICSSTLPYTWNGIAYNAAGIYTGPTLISSRDCDSVPTLNLTVAPALPPLLIQNPIAICSLGTVDITRSVVNNNLPPETVLNFYATLGDIATNNPIAAPTAITSSGIYYIQATSTAGCTNNPVSVAVTILASPSADAGTDKTTCDGSSAMIGSPQIPNFNYSWQPATGLNNATIAQPTVSGLLSSTKYMLTVTAVSNGCFSKDSVLVNLLPLHISLLDTIKQTCVGSTVSIGLDALPNCNYSWISVPAGFTSTLSNPSVVVSSVLTSYYLTATDTQTGCHGSAYVTVAIDSCLAANNAPVLAYPNPANQYISIKFNQTETGTLYFQLIDDKGQIVINNTITYSYPLTINVAALPAGKYYYTILNSSGKTLKSDRIMILR
jgi:hypothetical protein